MSEKTLYERANKVMPPVAKRVTELEIEKGKGAYLWDKSGKKYLDFASGIGVTNLGHNHPHIIEKAKEQMDKLVHAGHNVVYYDTYVELAEKICDLMGGDYKLYFANSGAEAVEGAIKLAKWATKRPGVISFKRSFHGRTMGATSVTASNAQYRKEYEGLLPSVYYAEYPYAFRTGLSPEEETERCIASLDEIFHYLIAPEKVAAIIMEPVQGEGGYIVPPTEFIKRIRELCDEHGIMLIFDEVQTGFGRTGKMFAHEHFGVKPDIMSIAKGIANGFPLSAIVGKSKVMDKWESGAHGGTFGGNPIACAAGLAVIELLQDGWLENAQNMGEYFIEQLKTCAVSYPSIRDIRGLGLMIGMEFITEEGKPDSKTVSNLQAKALEKGLLLLNCGVDKNVIRFIPPVIVTKADIDLAVSIINESLKEITLSSENLDKVSK
ncbi:aspartate aminotransferase family protein [Terrilactibacillus laevilacticus]|uniref:Aspartate aminotransferase family protein n=1 Tax=Terrilactibacillus laevilacticus TaxID=1380157 RepID=A0ABW5PNF6_9BACI|nr:aspartate aminotransferase family protein [Terrilactibacillus laevilacticus]